MAATSWHDVIIFYTKRLTVSQQLIFVNFIGGRGVRYAECSFSKLVLCVNMWIYLRQ